MQRSTLLCPEPSASEFANTTYTSFTPQGSGPSSAASGKDSAGSGASGSAAATLVPATAKPKALKPLTAVGKPATSTTSNANAPALIGTADGPLAPGWTVQQSTVVDDGPERGLLGLSCVAPDSEFWFPGASTEDGNQDYVHLVNPDETPAVVDIELYGKDGLLKASTGDGITVPGSSSKPVLLSTLVADKAPDLTVHVVARSGRVGAAVQATDVPTSARTGCRPPRSRPPALCCPASPPTPRTSA